MNNNNNNDVGDAVNQLQKLYKWDDKTIMNNK
jgi:hypothetical protein